MTLNLDKHKNALVEAWKEVMDEKNPIDWALFGYDGQTYDLNLVSKGDGGLDEMVEDFNSGKIQYALCRVKIKDKNVQKILLINWQGEGAPLARKGMCANHLGTIKSFFKGVHVTMNARTDEDVEPDLIVDFASKAIAGEGIKMSSSIEQEIGPVGTCYKRVNPKEEINSKAKDDFWRQQEQEEERRRREEQTRLRKFSQDEVKLLRKESQDYFDKEEQEAPSMHSSIIKSTPSPKPSPLNGNGFTFPNGNSNNSSYSSTSPIPPKECAAATAAALKASTPMKNNNSDLVRQRVKSFDGGESGGHHQQPVFPSNGTAGSAKSNGTSSYLRSPGIPGGIRSPSPTNNKPVTSSVNGSSNDVTSPTSSATSESLSVLKRRQMFEGGGGGPIGPSNGTTVQTGRRNPAEEIRLAQEEQRKLLEKEREREEIEKRKQQQLQQEAEERKRKKEAEEIEKRKKQELQELEELKERQRQEEQLEEMRRRLKIEEEEAEALRKKQNEAKILQQQEDEERVVSPTAHFQADLITQPIPAPEGFQNSFEESPAKQQLQGRGGPPPDIQPQTYNNNSNINSSSHQSTPAIIEDHSVRSGQSGYTSSGIATASSPTGRSSSTSPRPQQQDDDDSSDTVTIEITPQMGLCARALYDYQAGDDTEITFDPGEIITNIERIDEGWWEGLGPRGQYGLFPANYVELLN